MTDENTEDIPTNVLGFEIIGATPEEKHQIVMMLCRLPMSHRKAFKELRIISEPEWKAFISRLSTAAGIASLGAPEPLLIRERCRDNLISTTLHEIGHTIWHNFLTEDERQDFLNIIEWVRGGELVAISWYAEVGGFIEHFAEAYANYVLKPRYLRRKEPDVYRWLKNYVFHGETYLYLEEKS